MSRFSSSMSWKGATESENDTAGSESKTGTTFSSWLSKLEPLDVEPGEGCDDLGGGEYHCGRARLGHRSFFLPLHYEANYRYPLVVWLHSDGYNESQLDHVMPYISLRNYVAAGVRGVRATDAVGHRFEWPASPAAVAMAEESIVDTIDEARRRFSVHPTRIVLAGYGSGGTMAMRVALSNPHRFAAVVSLGGEMPTGGSFWGNLDILRARAMPMLWSWATAGQRFDPQRLKKDIGLAMMIKASVEIRQYPVDDEMDTVALRDVNEWIMRRVVAEQSTLASDRWASSPTTHSAN